MYRPCWFMVCYDIADPKRLGRVHRFMKKKGIAAQKSLFFVQRGEREMKTFLKDLNRIIKKNADDIRAYPVDNPKKIWTTGGILETYPLARAGREKKPKKPAEKKRSFWRRILGR